ncbi:cell wall hydrolase [Tsuneonella sp. CC-YZS046]|uniref:cell wall hydrolase n=1 Tax=Tsuneonella sp. CC-YZS046 TaxID=3042152 RepID=UPI002D77D62F|nr:cell wall hydrolase [Tsuneonella sp. CC-YZS046]WRO65977.1 cell wall hydrolase [Tsuneonella sp. CC-YZS046]
MSTEGSGAFAQETIQTLIDQSLETQAATLDEEAVSQSPAETIRMEARAVVQPLPADEKAEPPLSEAGSLAELVSGTPTDGEMSKDMRCLAGAIYFESKGEPLAGQLAVGRVIVNRAKSGRFPATYCGVVYQPSQFSFVRGGQMPAIKTGSIAWREARAIAQIAHDGSWESPAKGALFFHARHVSPGWRLTRVAQVENHVFYR